MLVLQRREGQEIFLIDATGKTLAVITLCQMRGPMHTRIGIHAGTDITIRRGEHMNECGLCGGRFPDGTLHKCGGVMPHSQVQVGHE